jgi:hypothetical protein
MQAHGMVAYCLAFYFIMIGFDRQARLGVDREESLLMVMDMDRRLGSSLIDGIRRGSIIWLRVYGSGDGPGCITSVMLVLTSLLLSQRYRRPLLVDS